MKGEIGEYTKFFYLYYRWESLLVTASEKRVENHSHCPGGGLYNDHSP